LVYYNGFLYASTRTSRARILKIDPSTLTVVGRATIPSTVIEAEDIIAAEGYIWSIASTNDVSGLARLIRVDPDTMDTSFHSLVIDANNYLPYGESLDYSFGKLWAGGYNKIAEIDISTWPPSFDLHDYTGIVGGDFVLSTALANDGTYLWTMFLQGLFDPPYYIGTSLLRIDPSDPTVFLREDLAHIFPDDMVHTNGFLYTSTEDAGQPSDAYQFPSAILPYTSTLMSSTESYGVFHTDTNLQHLWAAYVGSPGILTQFHLDLTEPFTVTLPTGYDNPSEIAFDESGNMYVATWQSPAGLVKYTTPDAVALSITKSGGDALLSWTNADALVDHYEVWRSTNRNFLPWDAGATKVADVPAVLGGMSYTDVGAISTTATDYFYLVRAFNDFGLLSPISNRAGEINRGLTTGLNLITLPLAPQTTLSAETMLVEALNQGADCPTIYRWLGTTWNAHNRGSAFNNYPLTMGSGYFVRCTVAGNWTQVGNVPTAGTTVALSTGLNMIGIPHPPGSYSAQLVLDGIQSQGGDCPLIYQWLGTTWQSHSDGSPFNNFAINYRSGYFTRCIVGSTWTP
jgi:hypothetical protein